MFLIYLVAVEGVSPNDLSSAKKIEGNNVINSNHSMAPYAFKKLMVELKVGHRCNQHKNNTPHIRETNLFQIK